MGNFKDLYSEFECKPEYIAAGIQMDVAMVVESIMQKKEMNQSELAQAMDCSKPYITKILRGDSNFSILSLSKLAVALDSDLTIRLYPREKKNQMIQKKVRESAAKLTVVRVINDVARANSFGSSAAAQDIIIPETSNGKDDEAITIAA